MLKARVYYLLTKIPKGYVTTYKEIAIALGNAYLSRAVGNILHQNKEPIKYPCYKVVNAKGNLSSAYAFGGIEAQKKLLIRDGISISNNKVDLNKYLYKFKEEKNAIYKHKNKFRG